MSLVYFTLMPFKSLLALIVTFTWGVNVSATTSRAVPPECPPPGIIIVYDDCYLSGGIGTRPIDQVACSNGRPAILDIPGYFSSPSAPDGNYTKDAHCSWLLKAPEHHVVRLSFGRFDLEPSYPCVYANVTVHDGIVDAPEDFLERFCGTTMPPRIHSSGTDLLVTFKSALKGLGTGITANFEFVDIQVRCLAGVGDACSEYSPPVRLEWNIGGFTSPGYPVPYPPNTRCSWIISPSEQSFRLHFPEWNHGTSCSEGSLMVYDGSERLESAMIGSFCGDAAPPILGARKEEMLVHFRSVTPGGANHPGFRARFQAFNVTTWGCGNRRPAEVDWAPGNIISPQTENSLCRWRFQASTSSVVKLEIEHFDLPECVNCGCGSLSFFDGENERAPLLGKYCGSGWPTNFVVSGGNRAYLLYESYKLAPNIGFKIKYSFFDIAEHACGDSRPINLTEIQGILTSPNYGDGFYPNNINCQWRMQAREGEIIRLDFLTFGIEYCPGCSCDRLSIYNGDSPQEPLVRHFCDYLLPMPLTSTTNALFLRFRSDRDRGGPGFKIQYHTITLSDLACGTQATPVLMELQPGDVMSPNFGGYYPPDSSCQWLISAPYGKVIEVEFSYFDVEFGYYCEFDYLAIYDGDSPDSHLLAQLCGKDLPSNVTSTKSTMLMLFVTNLRLEQTGFKARYIFKDGKSSSHISTIVTAICGSLAALGFLCLLAVCLKVPEKILRRHRGQSIRSSRNEHCGCDAGNIQTTMTPPSYDEVNHLPPSYEESLGNPPPGPIMSDHPPAYTAALQAGEEQRAAYTGLDRDPCPPSYTRQSDGDNLVDYSGSSNIPASRDRSNNQSNDTGSRGSVDPDPTMLVGSAAMVTDGMMMPAGVNARGALTQSSDRHHSDSTSPINPPIPTASLTGIDNVAFLASGLDIPHSLSTSFSVDAEHRDRSLSETNATSPRNLPQQPESKASRRKNRNRSGTPHFGNLGANFSRSEPDILKIDSKKNDLMRQKEAYCEDDSASTSAKKQCYTRSSSLSSLPIPEDYKPESKTGGHAYRLTVASTQKDSFV